MKVTLIYPCLGRRPGQPYVRSWQMEPLPCAHVAGLTPRGAGIELHFFDDRMEPIDYDRPTDLVALTVETYTAKRAYQIASEYRRRGVPVVMGGFHATLVPEEVQQFAEATVVGEAEQLWPQVLADFGAGRLQRVYRAEARPDISRTMPDRSIFAGKRYLPFALIEAGRGCHLACEFCSIQTCFRQSQTQRSIEAIVEEIRGIKRQTSNIFFVDDNVVAHLDWSKQLFEALIPLDIKWVGQATIDMTHDEELLRLMKRSGCVGVLIGMESLDEDNLKRMHKGFNLRHGGPGAAIERLHRHKMVLYATFVFGYEHDTLASFDRVTRFCIDHGVFMIAYNHCTPFPGTPLYQRLQQEGRLLYPRWWLDDRYRYGQVPYKTSLPPEVIQKMCVAGRKRFYGPWSILRRMRNRANVDSWLKLRSYLFINALLRKEAGQREDWPLGDLGFQGPLVPVAGSAAELLATPLAAA